MYKAIKGRLAVISVLAGNRIFLSIVLPKLPRTVYKHSDQQLWATQAEIQNKTKRIDIVVSILYTPLTYNISESEKLFNFNFDYKKGGGKFKLFYPIRLALCYNYRVSFLPSKLVWFPISYLYVLIVIE